jgi:hypothetical protein
LAGNRIRGRASANLGAPRDCRTSDPSIPPLRMTATSRQSCDADANSITSARSGRPDCIRPNRRLTPMHCDMRRPRGIRIVRHEMYRKLPLQMIRGREMPLYSAVSAAGATNPSRNANAPSRVIGNAVKGGASARISMREQGPFPRRECSSRISQARFSFGSTQARGRFATRIFCPFLGGPGRHNVT